MVEQSYAAPAPRVWEALSIKEQMQQWFFETIHDFIPRVGFYTKFNVRSGDKNYLHVWRVIDVLPNQRLTLEWQYGEYPGDSFVTFELSGARDETHVKLTHRGQETFPRDEPAFDRESCAKGWNYFIGERLKAFVEKDK